MKKKSKFFTDKKIAMERIEILKKLISEHPRSHYNERYKELILKIKKKYRLFGKKYK